MFFLPFNSYEGVSALGEFAKYSCTLFFLAAAFLLGVRTIIKRKVKVPFKNPLFQLLSLFIIWMIVATLLNLHEVKSYYFKHTTGIHRFFTQFLSLFFSAVVFLLTYYNAFRRYSLKQLFYKIRKVFLFSFIIVSGFAILEIMILKFQLSFLEPVICLFDYFPFTEVDLDYRLLRVSSVTFEPPALATYLLTVAGWMFSYIITEKGLLKYIPGILTIVLALFSGSRSGIFIILVQALLFIFFLLTQKKYQVLFTKIFLTGFLCGSFILLFKGKEITNYIVNKATSFGIHNETHAVSNKSRFGIQYALGLVFLENPISGVGLGQQAFPSHHLYPDWATKNNWEFKQKYLNPEVSSFPPGYNFYLRLLAEGGAIGFLLFLALVGCVFYASLRLMGKNKILSLYGAIIFISMVGVLFNWLKMDSFKVFTFWIHLAILMTVMTSHSEFHLKESN